MSPDQCPAFSERDKAYANKLLRKDEKTALGITVDLDRPTPHENVETGRILDGRPLRVKLRKRRQLGKARRADELSVRS